MLEKLRFPETRKMTVRIVSNVPCLKQSIDCSEEPVGLTRLRPGVDAVEVIEDHLRHLFHRLDFGALDVGAPALEQGRNHVDLLAVEDVAPLLGAGGSFGGELDHKSLDPPRLHSCD